MRKIAVTMKDFNANLSEQFSNLKVGIPDFPSHLEHLYVDYVELIALFSNKTYVTSTDILDRLKDEGKFKSDSQEQSDVAEQNDNNEAWIDNIFKLIEGRAYLFNEHYPFNYSNNKIILKERLSLKHEVYIFLLISSNLNIFAKIKATLTSDFETISFFTLKNYLPTKAVVKQFGKQSDYSGSAIQKIKSLASDLKVEVREHELSNISERNNQERGLDLVGWIPFADNCPNLFAVLAQCACGKEWASKHHDTKRYVHYLKFYRLNPFHAMFIPYGLIGKQNGTMFFRSDDIEQGTLVFERKRIIELFDNEIAFNKLESKLAVSECIKYVEDIV